MPSSANTAPMPPVPPAEDRRHQELLASQDVRWVSSMLERDLTRAEVVAIWILCSGSSRPYHYGMRLWDTLEPYGKDGASVVLPAHMELATFDSSDLTALVVAAHDLAARLAFRHEAEGIRVTVHLRARAGGVMDRHPTLEAAAAGHRRASPAPCPSTTIIPGYWWWLRIQLPDSTRWCLGPVLRKAHDQVVFLEENMECRELPLYLGEAPRLGLAEDLIIEARPLISPTGMSVSSS